MTSATDKSAATRELMKKLLEVIEANQVGHSVAICALANLANNIARRHPCCAVTTGELFMQAGANLLFQAGPPPQADDEARPADQPLH